MVHSHLPRNMKEIPADIARLMKVATYASVSVASLIIFIKLLAWIVTDSLSLLASLVDSILDIAASIINLIAIHYALKPPDQEHRFGHNKAEDLASLIQAAFIAGSSLFILSEAIHRFANPQPIEGEIIGIWVMVLCTVLTLGLVAFQKYVIRKTRSKAIEADKLHYVSDLLVNLAVIICLMLSMFTDIAIIDPLIALFIAGYIFKSAWGIGKRAFDDLMDKEFSEEERQQILELIIKNPEIRGVHDLRTRAAGIKRFIQFHLELDGKMSLQKAHDIAEDVEACLASEFPGTEITIHQDPEEKDAPLPVEIGQVKKIPVKKKKK